ncbi:hypothetical protein HPB48_019825 [Haemaphysalis longicornis]|uniref:BPTI/Kunitz inhibitor domain-containing protein n=1 Tax=Haemaphysalis longicornis TaxID=44386 RepID=A0A9J6G8D4_HAELO|nr:hypothetical protein HPB48_019825 [Haemaphysalis longicornis]
MMHAAPADFETYCKPEKYPGPCKGYFPRWWFDVKTGQCEKFIYGGCQRKNNNYGTKKECELKCLRTARPCLAYFPRYYFNSTLMSCQKFIYGGCQGNANNFNTLQECQQRCKLPENTACLPKPEAGPCEAYMPRYYFDKSTKTCKEFIYGGCDGNRNNFKTPEECEASCALPLSPVCYLPKVVGRCLAYMPRYYYNTTTRMCEKFIYGGCGGNANNFLTFLECNQTCPMVENFACLDNPDPGMCAGYFPRYYFDNVTNTCKQFGYGGCGATTNYERRCLARAETGPCRAHVLLWAYDSTEGQCEQFTYGGCDGNDNKYPTKEDCEMTCLRTEGKNVC